MKLIEFIESFPTEDACIEYFKEMRLSEGVICRKCGFKKHFWFKTIFQFQCKECGCRTTLRSGTILQHSNLPFRIWFITIHLMTSGKKTYSAKEVQRQLGIKRYEPVWYMMLKIRLAMGERDNQYLLNQCVEIDEGFFEVVTDFEENTKEEVENKRGRGSEKQQKVLVMAQTQPVGKTKKGRPSYKCSYFKMKAIENLRSDTINQEVKNNISKDTIALTDKYSAYSKLKEVVYQHIPMRVKGENAGKLLPWVHISISNAKRTFLATFHHINRKYLQLYLDEFCYKLNRRYFKNLFNRALIACIAHKWSIVNESG